MNFQKKYFLLIVLFIIINLTNQQRCPFNSTECEGAGPGSSTGNNPQVPHNCCPPGLIGVGCGGLSPKCCQKPNVCNEGNKQQCCTKDEKCDSISQKCVSRKGKQECKQSNQCKEDPRNPLDPFECIVLACENNKCEKVVKPECENCCASTDGDIFDGDCDGINIGCIPPSPPPEFCEGFSCPCPNGDSDCTFSTTDCIGNTCGVSGVCLTVEGSCDLVPGSGDLDGTCSGGVCGVGG